jgi:hypothetical protein
MDEGTVHTSVRSEVSGLACLNNTVIVLYECDTWYFDHK